MARSFDDIFTVNLKLDATISVDLERIEEDPVWINFLSLYSSPEAFIMYLSYYIVRDKFLSEAPFTNGPGGFNLIDVEIPNGES